MTLSIDATLLEEQLASLRLEDGDTVPLISEKTLAAAARNLTAAKRISAAVKADMKARTGRQGNLVYLQRPHHETPLFRRRQI